jgi:hypothetical protein
MLVCRTSTFLKLWTSQLVCFRGETLTYKEPTQSTITLVIKQTGREVVRLPPTSAKVKEMRVYTPNNYYVFMVWRLINYTQGQLYLFRVRTHLISKILVRNTESSYTSC